MAQTAHAMADYCLAHPEEAHRWHEESEYLICLEVTDHVSLQALDKKAKQAGIATTVYTEPDMDDEATAIVFSPGNATRRMLASLPCAGKSNLHFEAFTHIVRHSSKALRDASYTRIDESGEAIFMEWETEHAGADMTLTPRGYYCTIARKRRSVNPQEEGPGILRFEGKIPALIRKDWGKMSAALATYLFEVGE